MKTPLLLFACLVSVLAQAQDQPAETANSCQLVRALDEGGRIEFRDGSYVTRKPTDRAEVMLQEQFSRSGTLRYRAEVRRRLVGDTMVTFDPATAMSTVSTGEVDGYANAGAYRCYEIDGRGYEESGYDAFGRDSTAAYRRVAPNKKTVVTGELRFGKDSVGTWRINDEQGRVIEDLNFRDGKRFGAYERFGTGGETLVKGQYYRGEAVDTIMVFDPITYETTMTLVPLGSSPCGEWQIRGADGVMKKEEYAPCN